MHRRTQRLGAICLLLFTATVTAQSPKREIISQLRERDLESALETLAEVVDMGVTIEHLGNASVPSAAGGVYRALAQRSTDERYELMEAWSLPTGERNTVRLLATPVPSDAPPKVFARGIGERPRDNTFAVASVGPVPGFFCSGWVLAASAKESGHLSRLKSKLKQLVERNTAGAKLLLMFAEIVESDGSLKKLGRL